MCYKIFVEHEHAPSKKTKITFSSRPREKEKKNNPRILIRISKNLKTSRLTLRCHKRRAISSRFLSPCCRFPFPLLLFPFVNFLGVLSVDGLLFWLKTVFLTFYWISFSFSFLFFFVSAQTEHKCIFLFCSTLLIPVWFPPETSFLVVYMLRVWL